LGRLDWPNKARLGFAGQLGLRLSRPARTCGLTICGGPARPNRPARGSLPSLSLSLTTWAQGAAPCASPDRWDPLVGHPPDLVWLPDLVWDRPEWPCVHVCQCVCVATPRGCSGKCPKGLAAMRTRRRGGVAWSPRTVRPWRGSWHGGLAWGACEGAQARAAARCVRAGVRMAQRGGGVASDGAAR
jgi:hypothetical protein